MSSRKRHTLFAGIFIPLCLALLPRATADDSLRAVYMHLAPFEAQAFSAEERAAEISRVLDEIEASGFNTIFPYANRSDGLTHYPSTRVAPSDAENSDMLGHFAQAARSGNLDVMPAVCVLVSGHDRPTGILEQHPEWALRDLYGAPLGWLSPTHPEARAWIVESLLELTAHLELDGLLLDYLRYPNKAVRLDPASEERFETQAPVHESDEEKKARLQHFKEAGLSSLMAEIHERLRKDRPAFKLALYTWGAHVAKSHPVAQPWPDWVASGYFDWINVSGYCYRENYGDRYLTVFEQRMAAAREQVLLAGGHARLSFALGFTTSHGAIDDGDEIDLYLERAERAGVEGVAAFRWLSMEPFVPELKRSQIIAKRFQDQTAEALWVFKAQIALGPDRGQHFGALFEALDNQGNAVAGAGFLGAYNTYFQADRHVLHAFVKPPTEEATPEIDAITYPSEKAHHYLFDIGDQVYATDRSAPPAIHRWEPEAGEWMKTSPPVLPSIPVGEHRLELERNAITLDGETVFSFDATVGATGSYYYAEGHLFFHLAMANDPERKTALYATPWDLAKHSTAPIDDAIILPLTAPGEFPYSYGQHEGAVIVGTNNGGIYRFREGVWQTLRSADPKTSFQLYTMINYYDRFLMGQYPTGELFEIVGDEFIHLKTVPPRPASASPSAREVQALTLYRGELFVGIWPWGEVWRLATPQADWQFVGRMFQYPAMTPSVTAPYEVELAATGEAINNLWGQRITSLIPQGDSLLISTANKNGAVPAPELSFLEDNRWREYGAVHHLRLPGHLSAPLTYRQSATELQIIISRQWLAIRQDGRLLAQSPLPPDSMATFAIESVRWKEGVFGPGQFQLHTQATILPKQ